MNNKEINNKIATEVMGWKWSESLNSWVAGNTYIIADQTFSPTTHLFDAWRVVEKLRLSDELNGKKVRIIPKLVGTSHPDMWQFSLTDILNDEVLAESQAQTASKAICMGALGILNILHEV